MKRYDIYDSLYSDSEDRKRLARLLMLSRAESGLSQEYVANELGIAKKTVQNWERGISAPTLPQAIIWFKVMGIAALPYLLRYIYPEMEGVNGATDDASIKEYLIKLISALPPEGTRQLMYLFYGSHGSSPQAVLNMITAHLQSPLRQRYNHAYEILSDYTFSKEQNSLTNSGNIQPNLDILELALSESRKAILANSNNYSLILEKNS